MKGIYPCGEGVGYYEGITRSDPDGIAARKYFFRID